MPFNNPGRRNSKRRCALALLAATVSFGLHSSRGSAQTSGTWIADSGSWSNTANWFNGVKPMTGGNARFGDSGVVGEIVWVDESVDLNRIEFVGTSAFTFALIPLQPYSASEIYSTYAPSRSFFGSPPLVQHLSGNRGFIKTGPGAVVTSQNTFTGDIEVREGRLIASDNGLGNAANALVLNGGAFEGTGWDLPATRNVVLGGNGGSLLTRAGFDLQSQYAGNISGSGTLTIGAIDSIGSTTFAASNTYTGATRVVAGNLFLGGNGAISNSSSITIDGGALIVPTSNTAANRFGDSAPITMGSGTFALNGPLLNDISEKVGALSTNGNATLSITRRTVNRTTELKADSLTRTSRGTLNLPTLAAGVPGIKFTLLSAPQSIGGGGGAGSANQSIVPFAASISTGASTFVTFDSATGAVRPLAGNEYSTLATAAADHNVYQNTDAITALPQTVNALLVDGASVSGIGTVSITSGAMLLRGTANVIVPLNFPGGEAIIGGAGTITSSISASNGVTFHDANLTVAGTSTYSGPTTINGGRVTVANVVAGAPGPLGSDSSAIRMLGSSTLELVGDVARDVQMISDSGAAFIGINTAGGATRTLSGNVGINGVLTTGGVGTLNLTGPISGTGELHITGDSTMFGGTTSTTVLTGSNTMSGGAFIEGGNLRMDSDAALGSGKLTFISNFGSGGIGGLGAPLTIHNDVSVLGAEAIIPEDENITLAGRVEVEQSDLSLRNRARVYLSGSLVGGDVTINGWTTAGTLTLSNANPKFHGSLLTQSQSVVSISNAGALGSSRGGTRVLNGQLELQDVPGGLALVGEPLEMTSGVTLPALSSLGGNNSWVGPIAIPVQAAINVSAGTLSMENSATASFGHSNARLTKVGAGTLILKKPVLNQLNVNAGTVRLKPDGTNAGAGKLQTLSMQAGTTLDLSDNDLHITGGNTLGDVEGKIRSAYNFGAWDGAGISSSAARDNSVGNTTVGAMSGQQYIDNTGSSVFDGNVVNATDVLVKYTYFGDVDFNGQVDVSDYNLIDFGFVNSLTGWANGDADYSGSVDVSDYNLIDFAFSTQNGTLRRAISYLDGSDRSAREMNDDPSLQIVAEHFQQFGETYAAGFLATVPEPASAGGAIVMAAAALMRRRRRRRRSI